MSSVVLKVRKKGVTVIPKRLREEAGIKEDSDVRAKVQSNGILLQPLAEDPVGKLADLLPSPVRGSSVTRIRELRKRIDRELKV
ncbi:MAG: AbrB/MazE/SpoVT family DNA-binding domain-containing protein [Nitrososphaerales archaeon]